ncbi:MAG: hypothetical protein H7Y27_02560 [Gemmatimonadaceae bacterium]|nr:hypothetical protein [Chitinophagaceae bacterium]
MLKKNHYILFFLVLSSLQAFAQQDVMRRVQGAGGGLGGAKKGQGGKDSLRHRTGLEDSITINFRTLDSSRYQRMDTSITDFFTRYPIPADYLYLGNTGSAARPLLFSPNLKPGWDPGFHAYDVYFLKPEETRFYNTTRPYSELGYLLGSRGEQMVHVKHTQNVNPNWNIAMEYRLINSPGTLKNQNASHSNFRINSFYQSPNRRYHLFFILLNNKIQSSENGGILDDKYVDSLPSYKQRETIPVYLGPVDPEAFNPFSTIVRTGTKYRNIDFLIRQQYDLGKKDSIETDSTVIQLFYPKLRLEHTFQYNTYRFSFDDAKVSNYTDTGFYRKFYNFLTMPSTYYVEDEWKEMVNDLSIYSFPDSKNPQQYVKLGVSFQNLSGKFDGGSTNFFNTWAHGEYRNKTKNQKWDIEANAKLYLTGLNFGDYSALASLQRYVSRQVGYLKIGAQNVNRTPSFVFNEASSFNLANVKGFNKENTIRLFGEIYQPIRKLRFSGNYYFITNYSYFSGYYQAEQASGIFNLLQLNAEKLFQLTRHLVWRAEISLQQKAGSAPVNVPLLFTRTRIGYEGNLGFKNLSLVTGLDIRYHTPFKSDGYSPVLGQFFYQDNKTVSMRLPTISAYFHFRIKTFAAYVRAENLNTARLKEGFGFTNNNLAISGYPYPGLQIRFGIFWSFIN